MKQAEEEIQPYRERLFRELKSIQDELTRAAELDPAVAVRNSIRNLKVSFSPKDLNVLKDPGNLTRFSQLRSKRPLYFRVTGRLSGGALWGTDLYTADSTLALAVVHAGLLKSGQSGIVVVQIEAGQSSYQGSHRNGVSSSSWEAFDSSYRVSPGPW